MADLATVQAALKAALGEVMGADEFDIVEDETGALDVMADEWSLRVEGWPGGIAFVTVEDEPPDVDAAHLRETRRRVMGVAVERALAVVDGEVGGALAAALRSSRDPLSSELADALAEYRAGE